MLEIRTYFDACDWERRWGKVPCGLNCLTLPYIFLVYKIHVFRSAKTIDNHNVVRSTRYVIISCLKHRFLLFISPHTHDNVHNDVFNSPKIARLFSFPLHACFFWLIVLFNFCFWSIDLMRSPHFQMKNRKTRYAMSCSSDGSGVQPALNFQNQKKNVIW